MCCGFTKRSAGLFLLGFSVAEILMHVWLRFSTVLPITIGGFTLTPAYNNSIILFWILLAGISWYLAASTNNTPRCEIPKNRPL